jgi:hypothetical protein
MGRRQCGLRLELGKELQGVKPLQHQLKGADMPIHTLRRGDSLWGLAHRYLDSGTKWRAIYDRHNEEAAKPGRDKRLIPIEDPNLIYVGQYIMIPGDRRYVPPGTGDRFEANQPAKAVDLKISYTIGRDTLPMVYVQKGLDHTITSEVSGTVGIELKSPDRFRHNLELFMCKNPAEAKYKLEEIYDPALGVLLAKPELDFDSATNKVRIKAPIAAKAGLGPYTFEIQLESPLHLSGSLKPTTLEGGVEIGGRRFKFSAELEFKIDVYLKPKPRGRVEEPVGTIITQNERVPFDNPTNAAGFEKIATTVAWTIIGIGLAVFGYKAMPQAQGATTIQPFFHIVDPRNPRNRKYFNNNA